MGKLSIARVPAKTTGEETQDSLNIRCGHIVYDLRLVSTGNTYLLAHKTV